MSEQEVKTRHTKNFADRLEELEKEFGSRRRLATAAGVAEGALQQYARGSKPGLDILIKIARAANVNLEWLAAGFGEKRTAALPSGATWADIVAVALYEMGSVLMIPKIIGMVPFSRDALTSRLGIKKPSYDTLMVVEADVDLAPVRRSDLVLVDRDQTSVHDGIYLVHAPGLALRRADRVAEMMKGAPANFMVGRAVSIDYRKI
jgi:transcriptional regulator with XRE-family HTH domain